MKRISWLLALVIVFMGCKEDDPCAPAEGVMNTSPIMQYISVALVDAEDNNLIENGTFSSSEIKVSVNGGEERDGVFLGETKITVFPTGESTTQTAVIKLGESIVDTLELNLTIEKKECSSIRYIFNSAIYNGQSRQLVYADESESYPTITVVKE